MSLRDFFMKYLKPRKNAFTLFELVIVVVILSIMTAVSVPRYMDTVQKAKQRDVAAILALVRSAQVLYKGKASSYYPTSGTVTINDINQKLNLSIIQPSDIVYECEGLNSGANFKCYGYYPSKDAQKWARWIVEPDCGLDTCGGCIAGAGGKCFTLTGYY